ncbi:NAD-dependent protein deacetylase sirtuin-2 [Anabrus simplex]|uniref:NAD-dependent protein deacetylase sirtuin-2 n=1 Tax=Anabrus simplex TaxID=316456 RepID=UPI0034DD2592
MASSAENKQSGDGYGEGHSSRKLNDSGSSSSGEEAEGEKAASSTVMYERVLEKLGIMKPLLPDFFTEKPKVLDEKSIHGVVKYIKEGKCKNIITLAGAGISTSSGIPDFRSPGSGLYHNLQKYNLPNPQAIFEIDFFVENPKPFFHLAKELYPGMFKPTVCHYFVRLLHEKGLLLRHYTQNIDTLERVAGIPDEAIVEAHGTFHTSHCLGCREEYPLEWMKERIFSDVIPKCEKCEDLVKPDIVFFGENLPTKFFERVSEDFEKCDLLIVMGSSLTVQPFASLIDRVPRSCPRLLINRTKAGEHDFLWSLLGQGSGMDFESAENTRDVAWLGDCDDGCRLLASELGWGEELEMLVMTEHMKILSVQEKKKQSADQIEGKKDN